MHGKVYSEGDHNTSKLIKRCQFATHADIRRIQKKIDAESVRLASDDGESVLLWVERLRALGHHLELKRSCDPTPEGSTVAKETFILIIQTKYQRECWQRYGTKFAGLDATHNTTHYTNMSLFTLMTRDKWGQGLFSGYLFLHALT